MTLKIKKIPPMWMMDSSEFIFLSLESSLKACEFIFLQHLPKQEISPLSHSLSVFGKFLKMLVFSKKKNRKIT
jgi:hypothetical protein